MLLGRRRAITTCGGGSGDGCGGCGGGGGPTKYRVLDDAEPSPRNLTGNTKGVETTPFKTVVGASAYAALWGSYTFGRGSTNYPSQQYTVVTTLLFSQCCHAKLI